MRTASVRCEAATRLELEAKTTLRRITKTVESASIPEVPPPHQLPSDRSGLVGFVSSWPICPSGTNA